MVKPLFQDIKYKIDVLLGNPPFTKGSRLSKKYREFLSNLEIMKKHKFKANFSAIGLHALFLLIGHYFVSKKGGKIGYILPFGAINSFAMVMVWKILFKENFGIKYIISASTEDRAFSDAGAHEIMVVLERNYEDSVKLIQLKGHLDTKNINALTKEIINIKNPTGKAEDFNYRIVLQSYIKNHPCTEWSFEYSIFLELFYSHFIPLDLEQIPSYEKSNYTKDLKNVLNMVGRNRASPTDYWLIPNKYWNLKEVTDNKLVIQATSKNTVISKDDKIEQIMTIPKDLFVPAVQRSIRDYEDYPPIVPKDESSLFYLKDETLGSIKKYYEWGQKAHKQKLFGKEHSGYSIAFNEIGIPQRINFVSSKTLALRFLHPSMGAGVIMFGFNSENKEILDLFFSYLTSSLFLLDALYKSRKRSSEFVRIHQIDFYNIYKFPDLDSIKNNSKIKEKILNCSKKY